MRDVVVAVIVRDGRVLLAQRKGSEKNAPWAWESPGGKCEPGESHRDALYRELLEELGVAVDETDVSDTSIFRCEAFGFQLHFYEVHMQPWCRPSPAEGQAGIGWFLPEEMRRLRMTRIVFLDFDGVLNSTAFALRHEQEERSGVLGLDPVAVARVNRLIAETGAEVVVSSTWRRQRTRVQLVEVLRDVGFVGTVRGKTPNNVPCTDPLSKRHVGERGDEIQAWLDVAPRYGLEIESFVIIDDDSDMRHLAHRLVKTDFEDGLLDEHVERAIAMLKSPPSPSLITLPEKEDIRRFGGES